VPEHWSHLQIPREYSAILRKTDELSLSLIPSLSHELGIGRGTALSVLAFAHKDLVYIRELTISVERLTPTNWRVVVYCSLIVLPLDAILLQPSPPFFSAWPQDFPRNGTEIAGNPLVSGTERRPSSGNPLLLTPNFCRTAGAPANRYPIRMAKPSGHPPLFSKKSPENAGNPSSSSLAAASVAGSPHLIPLPADPIAPKPLVCHFSSDSGSGNPPYVSMPLDKKAGCPRSDKTYGHWGRVARVTA
jgi:hypothetical protein